LARFKSQRLLVSVPTHFLWCVSAPANLAFPELYVRPTHPRVDVLFRKCVIEPCEPYAICCWVPSKRLQTPSDSECLFVASLRVVCLMAACHFSLHSPSKHHIMLHPCLYREARRECCSTCALFFRERYGAAHQLAPHEVKLVPLQWLGTW
jgi:hypothetical protein